jgi:hypothetical protein
MVEVARAGDRSENANARAAAVAARAPNGNCTGASPKQNPVLEGAELHLNRRQAPLGCSFGVQAWWPGESDSWAQTYRDSNCDGDWQLPAGVDRVKFFWRECPACSEQEKEFNAASEAGAANWDNHAFCILAHGVTYLDEPTYSVKGGSCNGD